MSREIKFRAWDKDNHIMIYPAIIGINYENFAWDHSRSYLHNCQDWCGEDGFIYNPTLMQFTGLKDKNDVEIYEGDIVKDSAPWAWVVRFGKCRDSAGQEDFIGWYLEHQEREDFNGPFSTDDLKYLEVIGNIYQHPHLISKS